MQPQDATIFRHEAIFYDGLDGFVSSLAPFIRDGLAAEEPVLVVTLADRIAALTDAIGRHDLLRFLDMAVVGRNPSAIISLWRDVISANPGQRVRGVGEPIWVDRDDQELIECARHEALLNLAFAHDAAFVVCPYDVAALPEGVVKEARRTHPTIVRDGVTSVSADYQGTHAFSTPFDAPLPPLPRGVNGTPFDRGSIRDVRRAAAALAVRSRLSVIRQDEFTLAVSELIGNTVRHGGGDGIVSLWADDDRVWCQVSDKGSLVDPLVGRQRPQQGRAGGFGLWMVNQLCDLVQVRSGPNGVAIRIAVGRAR